MELAATLISAIALLVAMLGLAWTGGRKIGKICQRLKTLEDNYTSLVHTVTRIEGRMVDVAAQLGLKLRTGLKEQKGGEDGRSVSDP